MENTDLNLLASKIEQLILRIERLESENQTLREAAHTWQQERAQLVEKNENARHKVEAMISRLKALEQDS